MRIFFFLFFSLVQLAISQSGSVSGIVTSEKKSIPSVNIILIDTNIGTITDSDGQYFLHDVPVGKQALRFSAVGYESQIIEINITGNRQVSLDVELASKVIEVNQVEIIAKKHQSQKDTRTSLISIEPRSAKILAGGVEDVLRTLQTLPGVLAPNDFTSQIIVRGSGPDQNLIILDDVEVFNPYRLYGVISMFNPEVVSDINLVTGGFPARYGDRLSAVLDISNREGANSSFLLGNINASIVTANLVLEGKNPFGLNGSWLFNSRRTYYDLIVEPIVKKAGLIENDVTFPNFYDIQSKLVFGPWSGHKFLFNEIYSRDGVDIVSGANRNRPDSIGVINLTKNDLLSAAWHFSNKKFLNKLTVSWYRNGGNTEFDARILDPSLNRELFNASIPDTLESYLLGFSFNSLFSFRKYSIDEKLLVLYNNHEIEIGAGVDFMQTDIDFEFKLDPQLQAIFNSNPNARSALSSFGTTKDYLRYKIYLQDNFPILPKLFFQPSLRFDYYDILEKPYFAPRLSFSYEVDKITTIRALWGLYFQSPGYEKIRDQNVLYDFNPVYTENLEAEKATHSILSFERFLTPEWNAKVEFYYKDFRNLIVPKKVQGTRFKVEPIPGRDIKFKDGWQTPTSFVSDSITLIPANNSSGNSFGLEFLVAKLNVDRNSRLNGWISYAFAYSNRIEDDIKIPFRYDQRHTVNIVLNYLTADWLEFGIKWQYGSGFPFTEPIGIKPRIVLLDKDKDGVPETPEVATRLNLLNPSASKEVIFDVNYGDDPNRFNARKPAYHRLDIRATFFTHFWNLDWTFYLDVINVYNRANVINYDYSIDSNLNLSRKATTMFPIIPTFGFSVKF
ncbi:MAG: TonB-dependent receptor [Ignavibacteria bacterium]|nr:TonB-dependent receptor [Ignavibacteria bacterium]